MTRLLASGRASVLVLAGIVLLSFNLRPAAVAVGPVLAEVRGGLSMSAASAGLLTSLPVLAFAGFGAAAPTLARRVGVHRATLLALLALVVGLATRALVPAQLPFLALSMLALSGMAVANVLLPSLVKLHFPDRVGTVTALYTGAMSIGLTAALMLTVPISDSFGGWRLGIGAWAIPAVLAVFPWLWLAGHDRRLASEAHDVRLDRRGAHPAGLGDGAVLRAAVDAGVRDLRLVRPAVAGQRLLPRHGRRPGRHRGRDQRARCPCGCPRPLARRDDQRGILLAVMACYPVAYLGLMIAPHDLALLWAVIVGIGTCTFPLILTFIGLRSRTPAGTAALSGFTQSAGYLVAAAGPFTIGAAPRRDRRVDRPADRPDGARSCRWWRSGCTSPGRSYLEDQLPERSTAARVAP